MKKILLFGGHGKGVAHNRGFKTVNGRKNNEGDNNIRVEKLLKNYLVKNYEGMKVDAYMSDNNISKDINPSTRSAKGKGYDLYLSIHSNAGGGTGVETYISYKKQNRLNVDLAKDINSSLSKIMNIPNRGVRMMNYNTGRIQDYPQSSTNQDYLGEIRSNKADRVLLVELFFHDNVKDVKAFYKHEKEVIKALGDNIARHLKLKKKSKVTYPEIPFYAKVINPVLNIRDGATVKAKKVGQLKQGDVYTITEVKNNWGKLKYDLGWISLGKKYVETMKDISNGITLKEGDQIKIDGKTYKVVDGNVKLEEV